MNKHASMNRAFRLIWSAARGAYIVAPETARGHGKSGRAITAIAALGFAGLASAQVVPATTVIPVPGKTNAYISPNGVPVVNINTANAAGVSHNQYNRYDVEANGLVLNNGNTTQSARQSQLAGQVVANTNLSAEARVILNEVVSTNRSTLAGFTEVLGSRADVIVANPYGITCSGCGFINSDRVTLTTGAPRFGYDGSVAGFDVRRGDILINGGGLNASAQQILDLVTRSLRIEAPINTAAGGSLGIVTGNNAWSYDSRNVTGSTTPDGAAPAYAIDSTALGGMYAGRIRIIATEAGVGVRMLGDAAASVDDFRLDAAGRVQLQGKVSAAHDLQLAQHGDAGVASIEVSGSNASLTSGNDLALASDGGVTLNEGLVKANGNLALQARSLNDVSSSSAGRSAAGNLSANISDAATVDGTSWSAGNTLAVHAGSLTVGGAGNADSSFVSGSNATAPEKSMSIVADGNLSLDRARLVAASDMNLAAQGGALHAGAAVDAESAGNMALTAKTSFDNSGKLLAAQSLQLSAADANTVLAASNAGVMQAANAMTIGAAGMPVALNNAASGQVLAEHIAFNGTTLENSGVIQANSALNVAASGTVSNGSGATLLAQNNGAVVNLNAGSLVNAGTLQSGGTLNATTAGAIGNSGTVQAAGGAMTLAADSVSNSGTLAASGDAALSASGAIANSGLLQAANVALTTNSGLANSGAGSRILAAGNLAIGGNGETLSNEGLLQAGQALTVGDGAHAASSIDNRVSGVMLGNTLTANTGSLANAGTMQGNAGVAVNAGYALNNAGSGVILNTAAGADISLQAASISNAGVLQSARDLQAQATGAWTNSGVVVADNSVALTAGAGIDNSHTVQGGNAVSMSAGGAVNNSGGVLAQNAGASLTIGAASVTNAGALQSGGAAQITAATGSISNSGVVLADGDVTLAGATAVNNQGAAAKIVSLQDLTITGAVGAFNVSNDGSINAGGDLRFGDATHRVTTLANNAGAGSLGDTLQVTAATINNAGALQGDKGVTIQASGAVTNAASGQVASVQNGANITLNAATLSNAGTMQAAASLNAASSGALSNSGKLVTLGSAGDLSLQGSTLGNSGTVQSAGTAHLSTTSGALTNSGTVQADGDITLSTATALNNSGAASKILGANNVKITAPGSGFTLANDGRIQAAGALAIGESGHKANALTNNAGATLFGGTLQTVGGSVDNSGRIQSMGAGALNASTVYNHGSSSVILLGIDGSDSSITASGLLTNEGAIHGNGNLGVTASGIANTNTAGLSAIGDLTITANSGGISNAGALYAGAKLTGNALGQDITNTSSGTMDGTDIVMSSATFENYNTVIATHDASITTTQAFSNLPTGGVPNVVTASVNYGNVTVPYDTGDYNCNIFGDYCDHVWVFAQNYTVTQKLDASLPIQKGQIIAGNNLAINYGNYGTNTASLISATNVSIGGSGTFNNVDLHLDQIDYARRWRDYKTDSTFGSLNHTYTFPTSGGQFGCNDGGCFAGYASTAGDAANASYALETGRHTIQTFGAGIYATNLVDFTGQHLANLGSPYAASTNAPSVSTANAAGTNKVSAASAAAAASAGKLTGTGKATGASATAMTTVPSANGISFTGLNLSLPSNPNGYFVQATNPNSHFIVETNPLFAVGTNFVGSDYLSVRLGLNPDTVEKRLGDANYEAKLIRDQLVAQTGSNILKGKQSEAAQMQSLMDNAASQAGTLGLAYGKPLTQAQAASLTQDMVWMVEQEVGGQKVLVPVVYLAQSTRDAIETGGPVIAANQTNIKANTVTNTGGVIAGSDKLNITASGDITNTGGKIKGGDVSVTSTGGSIINQTLATTQGGKDFARTTIGATGSIESTGSLNLDAARDITVKGAQVKAGGDATLAAGGAVTFDTIQNKTADATYKSSQGLWGMDKQTSASSVSTTKNIGSGLETGGNLQIKSGGDTTIAGSQVKVGGDLGVNAGGNLNVVSRQDTVETTSTNTHSGLGVGGGLYGTSTTTTDKFKGTNVASGIEVGGNADLNTANTLTLQGSKLKVDGDARIGANDVQVLAGQDVERSTTKTSTTSFLKIAASGDAGAGAGAGAGASSGSAASNGKGGAAASAGAQANAAAGAQANANGSAGLTLAETSTTTTTDYKSHAVGSQIDVGNNLTVDSKKSITLQGATVNSGGDTTLKAKDVNILASQDVSTSSTKTTTTSVGIYVDSANGAQANASAGAQAGAQAAASGKQGGTASASAQASAGAQANASANSDTTIDLVRTKTTETDSLNISNNGSSINAGGKLKIAAGDGLTVQSSDLGGDKGVSLQAKDMKFVAAQDVNVTTTKTTSASAGLYISGNADAQANASAGVSAQGSAGGSPLNQSSVGGSANAEAGASASAKLGAGYQAKVTTETSTEGSTTARVSTIRSGSGDIERTAQNGITDVGTAIEAAGDFKQSAKTIDSRAAANTSFSSSSSETNSARVGVYASADAGASAGASGQASSNSFGGAPKAGAEASANASLGIEGQYTNEKNSASSASSQAVVSTIKAGGKVSSTSSEKTTLEGTQISGDGGVSLAAKDIDFKAAKNTETSSSKSSTIDAHAHVAANLGSDGEVTGGLGGGYASDKSASSSSTAVVGGIQSGGNLTIKTQNDARFEGTDINAAGNATVKAGGNLKFDAAKNTSTSSSDSMNVSADLELSKSKGADGSGKGAGLSAEGGFAKDKSSSSEAVTGNIASGGKLTLSAGKDATFEGTSVSSGGDATIAAKGNVDFKAAQNTSSSESSNLSAGVDMSMSSSSNSAKGTSSSSKSAGISAEGGYSREKSSEAVTGSIDSGGNLKIQSGGNASFEGTDIAAAGKAAVKAGGDVNFKAAESTSQSVGVSASIGAEGSSTKSTGPAEGAGAAGTAKPAASPAAGAAAAAGGAKPKTETETEKKGSFGLEAGFENSTERTGGSIKAGQGGLQVSSGGNASFEGTQVKSQGDIGVAAKGNVNITAAKSTSAGMSASLEGEGGKKNNSAKPEEKSSSAGAGVGIEGGVSSRNDGASFASDGKLAIASGGKTQMVNADIKADGGTQIAAAGGLTQSRATDVDVGLKMGGKGSVESEAARPKAQPAAAPAGAAAAAAMAPVKSPTSAAAEAAPPQAQQAPAKAETKPGAPAKPEAAKTAKAPAAKPAPTKPAAKPAKKGAQAAEASAKP
ncbi:hemagglutinin repeat-containing protein [Noviherbaspirillum pedocola]|uniref:Hemagglutinin repeat-containing protein n=1 Tax=Noviherbaspirillum pedocola TaxID=2801341 RepID=A0A934T480_9BURK|nr:hemagglutinin repeat-containing protein [Noviherbaspirillum pedocola]MBK4738968.1 hemagglutinin repeat-containing protein [Noviherbaspirillum pedocola]